MDDRLVVRKLADQFNALARRISALERSPRSPFSGTEFGQGGIPRTANAWTPNYEFDMDAFGRRSTTSTGFQPLWNVTMMIATPDVEFSFLHLLSGGATEGELRFTASVIDDRGTSVPQIASATITLPAAFPVVSSGTLTVPASTLLAPHTNVAGGLAFIVAEVRVSAGSGTVAIAPTRNAWCV